MGRAGNGAVKADVQLQPGAIGQWGLWACSIVSWIVASSRSVARAAPRLAHIPSRARRASTSSTTLMVDLAGLTAVMLTAIGWAAGSVYSPNHTFDAFGYRESDQNQPGEGDLLLFDLEGMKVGVATCYDVRFP